jgi:hypothetical protein
MTTFVLSASPDPWTKAFEAATKVSSGFALGAFVAVAVVAIIWIVRNRANKQSVPSSAWIILAISVIVPIAANTATKFGPAKIRRATVLVLENGSPVTDLLVFNSINVPAKKTDTAFEFEIPEAEIPADKKVIFYAYKSGREGNSTIDLSNEGSLSVQINLSSDPAAGMIRSPLEVEAESKGKNYFIQSAVMTFDVESIPGKTNGERTIFWRTGYTIKALKDFEEKMEVFREEYNSDYATLTRWRGTEPEEDISPQGRWYFVKLQMKRGETKTFMTGANLVYEKPFPNRSAFCGNVPLGQNSDYAVFADGMVDGDYVEDLLIEVSSHSLKISPLRGDSSGIRLTRTPDCITQKSVTRVYSDQFGVSISSSWHGLKPGEEAGVLYQW